MSAANHFVDESLLHLTERASALIMKDLRPHLSQRSLNGMDWRILTAISPKDPLPISEIAQLCGTNQPNVSKQIQLWTDRGLVTRTTDPKDRRIVLVRLSPSGKRLVDAIIRDGHEVEGRILTKLRPKQAEAMKAALRLLVNSR